MSIPGSGGGSNEAMSSNAYIGPEQKSDVTQGAAPGGLVPSETELPVRAIHGGMPMTLGGYSASSGQAPLPPAGSSEGEPLAPSGERK